MRGFGRGKWTYPSAASQKCSQQTKKWRGMLNTIGILIGDEDLSKFIIWTNHYTWDMCDWKTIFVPHSWRPSSTWYCIVLLLTPPRSSFSIPFRLQHDKSILWYEGGSLLILHEKLSRFLQDGRKDDGEEIWRVIHALERWRTYGSEERQQDWHWERKSHGRKSCRHDTKACLGIEGIGRLFETLMCSNWASICLPRSETMTKPWFQSFQPEGD